MTPLLAQAQAAVAEARLELAPAPAWIGLVIGAAVGFAIALWAEPPGTFRGRSRAVLGAVVAAIGVWFALPWLVTYLVVTSPAAPSVPSSHGARPNLNQLAVPLFTVAAIPLLVPVAFVAFVQLAAAVAGRGRPAPFRRAARWARRGLTAILICFATLPTLAMLPTSTPSIGPATPNFVAAAALIAATLIPLAWATGVAWLGGPSARAIFILAANGACFGLVGIAPPGDLPFILSGATLNLGLPALVAAIALRRARLGPHTLGERGIEGAAAGDLTVSAVLVAPFVYLIAGLALSSAGKNELSMYLVYQAYALHWTPVLTSALFAAAILYLGRLVDEARGAARARAAREEARPVRADAARTEPPRQDAGS